jgi:hypothetical protein
LEVGLNLEVDEWRADISRKDALAKLLELNLSRIVAARFENADDDQSDLLDEE